MAIAIGQDITERKRAEVALRESEEKYRTLFESAPEAIMIIDSDGIILDCDEEAAKVSQLSRQQLIGKHFTKLDIFKEKEIAKAIEFFSPLVSERSVEFFEIQVVGAGNETRWVEVFPALLKRDDEVYAIQLIFRDITERKRVEEALRESEEKYRQLVSTTTEAIMVFDADTRQFIEVNKACEDLYGYTRGEFLNLKHRDITAEPEKSEDSINKARKGKLKKIPLRHHKKKDGTVFPVEISASNFELGSHRVLCGVVRDITDRKRAEEALRESEEKFRTLAEQSPNMIFINKKGKVIYANEKCEEIMGYKKDEFYSPNFDFLALVAPEYRKLVKARLARHIMGKEVNPYEYALITKEGKRIEAILSTKLISYRGEDAVLGMITDITERKRAEEQLRESEQRYRSVVDNIGIGVSLINRNMEIVSLNTQMKRWFPDIDISKNPICYRSFNNPPREGICSYCPTYKTLKDGQVHESITETPAGDEIRNYRIISSPIKGKAGKIIAAIEMVEEITERKQAEDALKQSEKKYRTLVETAQEGIGISDPEENLTFVNQAFAYMLGYKKQELLGKNLSQISDEEEFTKFKKETQKRKQGKLSKYEAKLFTKKGKPKYFYVSAVPIRTKNAGFKGTLAVLTDITELKRAREQNLLLEASKALSRTLKLDQVLKIATEKMAKALKADRCSVALLNKSADSAAIRHVFTKEDAPSSMLPSKRIPPDEHFPKAKKMLLAKGYVEIKNVETDPLPPSIRSYFLRARTKSSLLIPLIVDKKLFGVFHIGSTKKLRSFTSEEISLAQTIANQVAVAVENARLLELVRKSSEDLKTLSTQLINIQEEERKKIAQELHDEVGQTAFAMKMNLDLIKKNLSTDTGKLEDIETRLTDTEDLLSQTIDQIRNLTTDLRPSMLDDFGLIPTLNWYIDNLSKRTNIKVYLKTKNFKPRLSSEVETTLYRILQEALTNIAKHAQATEVSILLAQKNSFASLSVEDNGMGFDAKKTTFPKDRLGLFSIKERVKLLNGQFKIDSKPNKGTKLNVKIPLKERRV
jgi:PAS domain S-box-containing protein